MQAIERIRSALDAYNNEPATHFLSEERAEIARSCNPSAMAEVLAHIDALTAEVSASDIAIAEYRQQCLDNAAEIAQLRIESEERLQNCAALVAENEQLRKDAERYRFIRDADRSGCIWREICIYAMETLDEYVDAAMEGENS